MWHIVRKAIPKKSLWLAALACGPILGALVSALPPPMHLAGAFICAFSIGPILILSDILDAAIYTAISLAVALWFTRDSIADGLHFYLLGLSFGAIGGAVSYSIRSYATSRAMQLSDQRYKVLLRSFNQWVWTQDSQLRFISAGNVGESISEHERVEQPRMLGKCRWELPNAVPETGSWEDHKKMLEEHKPFFDFYYRDTNGEDSGQPE